MSQSLEAISILISTSRGELKRILPELTAVASEATASVPVVSRTTRKPINASTLDRKVFIVQSYGLISQTGSVEAHKYVVACAIVESRSARPVATVSYFRVAGLLLASSSACAAQRANRRKISQLS